MLRGSTASAVHLAQRTAREKGRTCSRSPVNSKGFVKFIKELEEKERKSGGGGSILI